jgi:hypothetical protein
LYVRVSVASPLVPDDQVDDQQDVRRDLLRAFRELRPEMVKHARGDADLDPKSRADEFSDADIEQILNAWEGLVVEALTGSGRATRDLVLDTALPPIVRSLEQTAADMIRSNTISAVMLTHRLLPKIAAERRDEAARWLAAFYGGYAHELVERVQRLESETR